MGGNHKDETGDGLHISTLLTVRSCTIMYCTYMYVFCMNKILFKPKIKWVIVASIAPPTVTIIHSNITRTDCLIPLLI